MNTLNRFSGAFFEFCVILCNFRLMAVDCDERVTGLAMLGFGFFSSFKIGIPLFLDGKIL